MRRKPADPEVLREKAIEVGLDGDTAEAIARSDQYADEVRAAEQRFMEAGGKRGARIYSRWTLPDLWRPAR
ncbi:hypothetical protein HSBAA_09920 [Vreelandella sulfidaeris]|uniref:DSBA-like thioredoxin domain-containing protein n=1 Tax=Vreelandella sulfidaeris TaxID=115553 RepID=A0A455U163_9GAMM|nr:hypothetical protein HSBAA_09920 [Halomonas sulfidaeris]